MFLKENSATWITSYCRYNYKQEDLEIANPMTSTRWFLTWTAKETPGHLLFSSPKRKFHATRVLTLLTKEPSVMYRITTRWITLPLTLIMRGINSFILQSFILSTYFHWRFSILSWMKLTLLAVGFSSFGVRETGVSRINETCTNVLKPYADFTQKDSSPIKW